MSFTYDMNAPKKATNLSINSDLLIQAKALKINLSAAFEKALTEIIKAKKKEEWLLSNKESIDAYNNHVKVNNVFSTNLRSF